MNGTKLLGEAAKLIKKEHEENGQGREALQQLANKKNKKKKDCLKTVRV